MFALPHTIVWAARACIFVCLITLYNLPSQADFDQIGGIDLVWSDAGQIQYRKVYETFISGRVLATHWIDLSEVDSVGQSFQCPGQRLDDLQIGVWKHIPGLLARSNECGVTVALHRGGSNGPIIYQKEFQKGSIPEGPVRLTVNVDNADATNWYLSITPIGTLRPGDLRIKARRVDSYPLGALHIDGREQIGDLAMTVTSSTPAAFRRPGEVVLWAAPAEKRIWKKASRTVPLMAEDNPKQPVKLSAAGNEFEAFQLVVTARPGITIRQASLKIPDLVGANGCTIPARIEWVRHVEEWKHRGRFSTFVPDALKPTDTAIVDQDDVPTNTAFWVTVHVPRDAPAGQYRTTATVTLDEKITLTREILLNVFDFSLPEETHTRTALFSMKDRSMWGIEDLADHRISNARPYREGWHAMIRHAQTPEQGYEALYSESIQQEVIRIGRLMNERGLAVTHFGPWQDIIPAWKGSDGKPLTEEQRQALQHCEDYFRVYYPIIKQQGWLDQAYVRLPDELRVDSYDDVRRVGGLATRLRQWAPGLRILGTYMARNRQWLETIVGCVDIWCPPDYTLQAELDFYQQRARLGRDGEEVWPYIHHFIYQQADPFAQRGFFWMIQKYGFSGVCLWSAGPRGKFEHTPWGIRRTDKVDPGDGNLYYPPDTETHSLWRSARLERIRQGLEDREYFWLMIHLADQARQAGQMTPDLQQQIDIVNAAPANLLYGETINVFTPDAIGQVQRTRNRIARIITDLRR